MNKILNELMKYLKDVFNDIVIFLKLIFNYVKNDNLNIVSRFIIGFWLVISLFSVMNVFKYIFFTFIGMCIGYLIKIFIKKKYKL